MSIQSIKDNSQGIIAKIIVGLIALTFALFGMEAIIGGSGSSQKAAEVNGDEITEIELLRASDFFKRRILAEMGEGADPDLIDDQLVRSRALDELIQRQLLLQVAGQEGLYVAEPRVDQSILQNKNFQRDGSFDRNTYELTLRNLQIAPREYKAQLTQDLLIQQAQIGLAASAFMTTNELEALTKIDQQVRGFSYITVTAKELSEGVGISDAEVLAYYEDNQADFMTEENMIIEYLELKQADFAKDINVSDVEVKELYQQEVNALSQQQERRAAHILIGTDSRTTADAEALIQEVADKLAQGEDFAQLAKTYSEDPGSADSGGDLGFVEKGAFVAPFEDALFSLNEGEVSDIVETEFGFHLIRLEELRSPEVPSLDVERERLIRDLKFRKAEEAFVAAADELQNDSFSAGDLVEPAQNQELTIKVSQPFTRDNGNGVASHSKVRRIAFSDELLTEGNNSDLIELSKDHVVVIRVKQHNPSKPRTLEEVADTVRHQLKVLAGQQNAQKLGEQIVVELREGKTLQQVADDYGYSVESKQGVGRQSADVDSRIVSQAFRMSKPDEKAPSIDSFINERGDFVVIALNNVIEGNPSVLPEQQQLVIARILAQQSGLSDFSEFMDGLKAKADIEKF